MSHIDQNFINANTERYIQAGLDTSFLDEIAGVISSLRSAGFDPYDQLTGYLRTGNLRYITRTGGAREIVGQMDEQHIRIFLAQYREGTE